MAAQEALREGQESSATFFAAGPGSWLIFADRSGVGEALAALLEAQGDREHPGRSRRIVRARGWYAFSHPSRTPEDLRQLFEAALASDQPGCRGLSISGVSTPPPPEETTVASLEDGPEPGLPAVSCSWSRSWLGSNGVTSRACGWSRGERRQQEKSPCPWT